MVGIMKDDLGDRMKLFFEDRSKTRLIRRMPVICRLDGKCFSKFCKRFEKPHDMRFHDIMNATTLHLCKEVSGTVFAEHHSDEISLLLIDYQTLTTEAYFNYEVQKVVSVVSGLATAEFCRRLCCAAELGCDNDHPWPSFDCRVFNLPKEEVENYFWWRMKDATRNSISMLAQSKFSHKQLQNVNSKQMQEMLFQHCGINWNDLPEEQKNGWCFVKNEEEALIEKGPKKGQSVSRSKWVCQPSPATRLALSSLFNYRNLTIN